jgi:uncharacterized repeat protein (TIGR03803 family)
MKFVRKCVPLLLLVSFLCAWCLPSRADDFTLLHSFAAVDQFGLNADGVLPLSVAVGPDGSLYGAAPDGGANGAGTVFKISPAGVFSVLHTFSAQDPFSRHNTDGGFPVSVAVGPDGSLYGWQTKVGRTATVQSSKSRPLASSASCTLSAL